MTPQDMKQLSAALRELAMMYPRADVGPETVAVYVKHLSDLPLAVALDAITQAGRRQTFFPAVAEIRQLAGERSLNPEALAERSWTHVVSEVRRCRIGHPPMIRHGVPTPNPTPVWADDVEREAVQSVGINLIQKSEHPEEVRKQYIFTYRAIAGRAVQRVQSGDTAALDALPEPAATVRELPRKAVS